MWPTAFFGSEAQVLPDQTYQQIRRAAADALVGKHRQTNPQVYQAVALLRMIRRLRDVEPKQARSCWQTHCSQQDKEGQDRRKHWK